MNYYLQYKSRVDGIHLIHRLECKQQSNMSNCLFMGSYTRPKMALYNCCNQFPNWNIELCWCCI